MRDNQITRQKHRQSQSQSQRAPSFIYGARVGSCTRELGYWFDFGTGGAQDLVHASIPNVSDCRGVAVLVGAALGRPVQIAGTLPGQTKFKTRDWKNDSGRVCNGTYLPAALNRAGVELNCVELARRKMVPRRNVFFFCTHWFS